MTQPMLSKRQARWVEVLAEFDYKMIHRPGKSNVVADALSRLHTVECGAIVRGYSREELFKCVIKSMLTLSQRCPGISTGCNNPATF